MRWSRRIGVIATFLFGGSLCLSAQSTASQSDEDTDTLRELIVRPDTVIRVPMSGSLSKSIKDAQNSWKGSLGGIVQHFFPTLNDQIMHPFGFKERKQNKKRKKTKEILEQYDALRDPLQELLDSVAQARGYVPQYKSLQKQVQK